MDIQFRGNCQLCGRQHAVVRGVIVAHGYTVKNGWFEGVCNGHNYAPLQTDRSQTDAAIARIRQDVADLRAKAHQLQTGQTTLEAVTKKYYDAKTNSYKTALMVFADLTDAAKREATNAEIYRLKLRASSGEGFADTLQKLADDVHGQLLKKAKKEAAPTPILIGDRKQQGDKILIVHYVEGGIVRYTRENGAKFAMSTRRWRALPDVVDEWEPVSAEEQERILNAECAAIRAHLAGQKKPVKRIFIDDVPAIRRLATV